MRFKNVKQNISVLLITGIILSLFAFTGCGGGGGGGGDPEDTKLFKAYNIETDSVYSLNAVLVYNGTYCNVYREIGAESFMSDAVAIQMGQEFDNNIYDKIIDNFGSPSDVDGDGKITLLVLDIKDGFTGSGGYVAGYFDPTNEYDSSTYSASNEMEMLYMDSYPGASDIDGFKQTMAHEFQHLVNFNQKVFVQGFSAGFDTWINEGMSSAAEKIYSGTQIQWKIDYYNDDPYGEIAQGQNFVAWGNSSYTSEIGNYATVYLFFQWLSIQGGGDSVYKAIMDNVSYSDYRAVFNEVDTATGCSNFGDLLRSWFIANLINHPTNLYGYKGHITTITVNYLNDLTGYPPSGITGYTLLPGEGVYLHSSGTYTTSSSSPVFNAGISLPSGAIDTDGTEYTGNVLLAYNIKGRSNDENGTTGALPNVLPEKSLKIIKSVTNGNGIYPMDVVFNENGKPSLGNRKISDKNSVKNFGKKIN
jgi:hypothetical protein